MPTRKQRRRTQKERRHEYETVWVDAEGNELEEPPEDLAPTPEKSDRAKSDRARGDGAKPKPKATQQRGGRRIKVPPPPSWRRAAKRAAILGAVIFAFIYLAGTRSGSHNPAGALFLAVIYTALFVPLQYTIDRFAYNRWQRRADAQTANRTAKKR